MVKDDAPFCSSSAFAFYLSCTTCDPTAFIPVWNQTAGLTCSCLGLQGFQTVLVDLLVELSAQACVTADSDSYLQGYPSDNLFERLPKLPASIVDYLMTANMHPLHKQYFVQHAFLPCAQNFVEEAHQAMVQWEADAAQMRLVFLPAALTRVLGTAHTLWAARYNTWLLIKLTPKGIVFSLLFFFYSTYHLFGLLRRKASASANITVAYANDVALCMHDKTLQGKIYRIGMHDANAGSSLCADPHPLVGTYSPTAFSSMLVPQMEASQHSQ